MIELVATNEGVLLSVRAQPGGRCNSIRGEHDGAIKISVTQTAEKGKANAAILEVLAESLQIARSRIELISGAAVRRKQFLVRGLTADELMQRIESILLGAE